MQGKSCPFKASCAMGTLLLYITWDWWILTVNSAIEQAWCYAFLQVRVLTTCAQTDSQVGCLVRHWLLMDMRSHRIQYQGPRVADKASKNAGEETVRDCDVIKHLPH